MADEFAGSGPDDTGASGDFDFDSIEGFELRGSTLEPVFAEKDDKEVSPSTTAEPEPESAPEKPAEPEHDWRQRYSDLRPAFDRTSAENAKLREELAYYRGRSEQLKPQEKDDEPEVDYLELMTDPKRAKEHFFAMVDRTVNERLAKYETHFIEMELGSELREVVGKYPDFITMQPHIHTVFETFPGQDITFEQAYLIAKKFFGNQPAQKEQPAPKPKVEMDQLRERARRVNPETGVSGPAVDAEPKVEINSLEDAFKQALRGKR